MNGTRELGFGGWIMISNDVKACFTQISDRSPSFGVEVGCGEVAL